MKKIKLKEFVSLLGDETPIKLMSAKGGTIYEGIYDLLEENSEFSYWFEQCKNNIVVAIYLQTDFIFGRNAIVIIIP